MWQSLASIAFLFGRFCLACLDLYLLTLVHLRKRVYWKRISMSSVVDVASCFVGRELVVMLDKPCCDVFGN